jgi:ACS family tartrate transporter-like MFS transporter
MDGLLGLAGWQWLYLVEGLPAVAIGYVMWRYLPDGPEDAAWLTEEERGWIRARQPETHAIPSRTAVQEVLSSRRYWGWGLAFFCATAGGSAFRVFQPLIFQQVTGLGSVLSALLSAVPALAGVGAILWVGRSSTRMDERRWHAAIPILVGAVGIGLVGVTYGVIGALIVASIASIGAASQPPLFASVSSVATGVTNAVGIAFVNSVAAVGAFLGPYLVGYALDVTGSLAGVCAMTAVVMTFGAVLAAVTREGPEPARAAAQLVAAQ